MSDSFSDAYRPDNKPKGFGWWSTDRKCKHVQQIFDRGDRDTWILYFMYWNAMITKQKLIDLMIEHHPKELEELGYKINEEVDQGKLF